MPHPRIFTIPLSAPFLPTLIQALMRGDLIEGFPASGDPLALAAATLYLPTRRACRLAHDSFLDDVVEESAAILPRIVALGDVDEDELAFAEAAAGELAAIDLELKPALGELERRLLLAKLILKWAAGIAPSKSGEASLVASNPVSALALADDLARFIDDMTTRGVPWQRLNELVPEDLDRYWQLTLEFLKIARDAWPAILSERDAIEASQRRDALIRAEAARLMRGNTGPVIAAGSTGSMPSTAGLIATIAMLPHGAVVLPGLDTVLDEESWRLIGTRGDGTQPDAIAPAIGHPQFAMHGLLARIGITRAQVAILPSQQRSELPSPQLGEGTQRPLKDDRVSMSAQPAPVDPKRSARERYVSEALRPAAATERWQHLADADTWLPPALESLSLIEAENAEEEALAIAVALREAVEEAKTAALITPDRALARRVLSALGRWKIAADDSGGDALAMTPAGRFACLTAQTALGGSPPVSLLALLKHPLTRLGAAQGKLLRTIAVLEMATLRGPRPSAGTSGVKGALATFRDELAKLRRKEASELHWSDPRAYLSDGDLDRAGDLVSALAAALAPLETLPPTALPLRELSARHEVVLVELSKTKVGETGAFEGHDGVKLAESLSEIASVAADADLKVLPSDYPELFKSIIGARVVRRPELPGVQVRVFGPLEARLQSADRFVLGGLVEGVWPPEPRPDPWLSRPMRSRLGLDLPERRISLSAHDFAQALGAPEVVLAYPARLAGAPTVPSRFVQRLAAVAGESRWSRVRASGAKYLAWARSLDQPARVKRIERPAPTPPRAARPAALTVTEIETWLRDPYSIYAKHILQLRELDPIDAPPGAAHRGIVIHGALSEFTQRFASALPDDAVGALLEIGQRHFAALAEYPEARAFWWPRFLRIARWFAAWEVRRRISVARIKAEISGHIEIPLGERTFTLRARADRIERLSGGSYAILDYKTGQVPTEKQVRIGLSPQLTLEAAILRRGGFPEFPAGGSIAELVYVSLKGGEQAGESRVIDFKNGNPDFHAELALSKLTAVAARFEDEQQPYLPLVLSVWKRRYGSYDHLARVKEWSVGTDEEAEAGAQE
jgi:ATP-dependent helicase/nuclease subunit B